MSTDRSSLPSPAHIGVLGLGHMGLPMAANLARAGFAVTGWARTPRAAEVDGLTTTTDPAALAGCDTLICLLPELAHLEAMLESGDVLPAGHATRTLVVMSTASPRDIVALDQRLPDVEVVDAPVSGGAQGAQEARLSIMVGGSLDQLERLTPMFAALGRTVRHMGPVGAGSVTKAANQLVVAATMQALAEATLIAEHAGLDRAEVLDVLAGGLASSELLTQRRHALATDDFTPTAAARLFVKDLRYAAEAGEGLRLPVRDAVAAQFDATLAAGLGEHDMAVLLETLRRDGGAPTVVE
jgi:2-hydroxy-3-oxopropionate reductase